MSSPQASNSDGSATNSFNCFADIVLVVIVIVIVDGVDKVHISTTSLTCPSRALMAVIQAQSGFVRSDGEMSSKIGRAHV